MSGITAIYGDITKLHVDAIVNAANTSLLGGGGVDGAIHRAGGPAILEACLKIRNKQGGCKPGDAVVTTAGKLDAKYVIHTVGPAWNGGTHQETSILAKAYKSCFHLAVEHACKSIAFPNISTGIYGFPKPLAAEIATHEVKSFLQQTPSLHVTFCCFDEDNFKLYQTLLNT